MFKPLVLCSLLLSVPVAVAQQKEVTLSTQLISDKPGSAYLAAPDEAIFLPPLTTLKDWGYSPIWVNKPVPKQDLPKDWKTKVDFDVRYGRSRAIVNAGEGTDFYGTGQVTGPLKRNGQKRALWATDNYVFNTDHGDRLYQAHPWVLAVRKDGTAFGVLADTTWRATLELTDDTIIFDSEGPVFPVVVFEGKTPGEVLAKLGERTGTTPMPPLWSLGYQQCRWSYDTPERGLEVAGEFRKRGIPADVMWMDIDYMDGYRVFTFNPRTFKNPKEYSDKLHDLGFKGVWMIDPGVKVDEQYAVFADGNKEDVWVKKANQKDDFVGLVWPGDCKFPDFTRKETREWWASLYQDFIRNNGVDGVWNDMNEPSVFRFPGQTMPVDNYHRGDEDMVPGPHLRYHNIYGMLMIKASRDGITAALPDKRPFILSRSNFLGGQRYGATWTGDNASSEGHMRMSIPMSINLGLSGQPFNGPDLGGFAGNASPKLWTEWVSFGAFYPFCRGHAVKGSQNKEPWAYGPETEQVAKTALQRRYRLIPYMYTLFRESTQNGMPVMRPVFFADPADPDLRDEETAFLVGRDVLIVPTIADKPSLPKGNWKQVCLLEDRSDADPAQAVVKIRPGAIVPLGKVVQHTGEPMLDELTLLVNPDAQGNAEGELYEDAGDGYGYRDGDYCVVRFKSERKNGEDLVTATVAEGKRPSAIKNIRVRLLNGDGEKTAEGTPGKPIIIGMRP